MAEKSGVHIVGDSDYKDGTIKKSFFTAENLNNITNYLIPNAKQIFSQFRQAFT